MIRDWETNCVFLAGMLKVRHADLFTRLNQILTDHGIEVRLLGNALDIWARDYCPVQVGPENLVKFRYDPDYLRDEPRLRTGDGIVKSFLDLGRCRRSPIILDGGNIVASRTKAIVTEKVYKENPGVSRAELRDKLQELLRVDQLIVVPKEPFDPIGHSDAVVRFIDEQSVLVNDYTQADPGYGERLFKLLRRHKLTIETIPYHPEQRASAGIPSAVGCFTNFLRTERVLVAPIFETKHDHAALRKLESVFPGLPIVPLNCTDLAREGGILNCVSASYRRPRGKSPLGDSRPRHD